MKYFFETLSEVMGEENSKMHVIIGNLIPYCNNHHIVGKREIGKNEQFLLLKNHVNVLNFILLYCFDKERFSTCLT